MSTPGADDGVGQRALVLAPLGRDAALTTSLLEAEGVSAQACVDLASLSVEIERGAALALLTEEVLTPDAIATLTEILSRQPPWSDFPLLVFTGSAASESEAARTLAALRPLGNVSLLERPVRVATLISAVNAALRARRRQYEVRALLEELQDGMRQRDEFLAMLGHELRNPLSALTTALQVMDLAEESAISLAPAARQQQKAIVRRQAQMLSRLVDDLLEVSRITSGKVALRSGRVELGALVSRAVDTLLPAAAAEGLTVEVARSAPFVWVLGDATRLDQIFANLLTNAIKYTPAQGRIHVSIGVDGAQAVVSVGDTGVGIEPEMLPRIFGLFRQLDRTLHRAKGGLGIGLTLVRNLVELHGGTVQARSEGLGRGSEFVVHLPLAPVEQPAPEERRRPASTSEARRVFVVEDHADNREALVLLLQQLGHEVFFAEDGAAGVAGIVETSPDVALVDIGLPVLDGYEVARRVRATLGNRVYLVALTGYGQSEDKELARKAGFDRHVPKPLDIVDLRRLLNAREASTASSA
jgi:signal transduction histidine kinase/ActR/RegA family two-component response regulator